MTYESLVTRESQVAPGVRFTMAKMSFTRRMELLRRIRDLAQKVDFLAASGKPDDKMQAVLTQLEIDRIYVTWGVREITGLTVDGVPVTPETLAEAGPENLFRELLTAVKAECGLSEDERKN